MRPAATRYMSQSPLRSRSSSNRPPPTSIETEPASSSVGLPGRHLVGAQVFLRTAGRPLVAHCPPSPPFAFNALLTAWQPLIRWQTNEILLSRADPSE